MLLAQMFVPQMCVWPKYVICPNECSPNVSLAQICVAQIWVWPKHVWPKCEFGPNLCLTWMSFAHIFLAHMCGAQMWVSKMDMSRMFVAQMCVWNKKEWPKRVFGPNGCAPKVALAQVCMSEAKKIWLTLVKSQWHYCLINYPIQTILIPMAYSRPSLHIRYFKISARLWWEWLHCIAHLPNSAVIYGQLFPIDDGKTRSKCK